MSSHVRQGTDESPGRADDTPGMADKTHQERQRLWEISRVGIVDSFVPRREGYLSPPRRDSKLRRIRPIVRRFFSIFVHKHAKIFFVVVCIVLLSARSFALLFRDEVFICIRYLSPRARYRAVSRGVRAHIGGGITSVCNWLSSVNKRFITSAISRLIPRFSLIRLLSLSAYVLSGDNEAASESVLLLSSALPIIKQ